MKWNLIASQVLVLVGFPIGVISMWSFSQLQWYAAWPLASMSLLGPGVVSWYLVGRYQSESGISKESRLRKRDALIATLIGLFCLVLLFPGLRPS